jgi:hypothetical protein
MTVSVTVSSRNAQVLQLVHDFARGLGCAAEMTSTPSGRSVRVNVDDNHHDVLELLTHLALSAMKAGVDIAEPLCQMTYHYSGVTSNVTLSLRLADVRIDTDVSRQGV